jgi:hypothetical protein
MPFARLPVAAVVVIAISGSPAAAAAGSALSVTVTGAKEVVLAYACTFSSGGTARGEVTPPWSRSWPDEGMRCRFERRAGRGQLTIEVRARGSLSRLSLGARGGSAAVAVGRFEEPSR